MTAWAAAFRQQPVLVAGGLGFIGSNLARRLADLGAQVTVVDALIPEQGGNWFNLEGYVNPEGSGGKISVAVADVREPDRLAQLVRGQAYVFDLVGQRSHLASMRSPEVDLDLNCRSQLTLLEACRQHNPTARLVFSSTRQIYGRPRYLPVDEQHPIAPIDINGVHKAAAESYHRIYQQIYGLRTTTLRLTNTYGPRMRVTDARQTFLGVWLRQVLEGQAITVYGAGTNTRDFNYVDDVVEALLGVATHEVAIGEVYNLGSAEVLTLRELAELLLTLHGSGTYRCVPFPAEQQAIEIGDYAGDYRKLQALMGWQPRWSLQAGLKDTLAYYSAHQHHYWH